MPNEGFLITRSEALFRPKIDSTTHQRNQHQVGGTRCAFLVGQNRTFLLKYPCRLNLTRGFLALGYGSSLGLLVGIAGVTFRMAVETCQKKVV